MAYKVLVSRQLLGGTIDYQKAALDKVVADLEAQLNSGKVQDVLSIIPYETDHEFILVAAVEVADEPQGE